MLHPSTQAVDYIYQHFADMYFSDETCKDVACIEALVAAASHRPFNPDGFSYKLFCERNRAKLAELQRRFPQLDFSREVGVFSELK